MAKRKPTPRKRKSSDDKDPIVISMNDLADKLIWDNFQKSIDENTAKKVLTDFGEITIHPDAQTVTLSKKAMGVLLMEDISAEETGEEPDDLEYLLHVEKMYERFPEEPQFAFERAKAYLELGKAEKAKKLIFQNYEKHKGFLPIDLMYGHFRYEQEGVNLRKEIFGDQINLHKIYPKRQAFTETEFLEYAILQAIWYAKEGEYETARKIASSIGLLKPDAQIVQTRLLVEIGKIQHPRKAKALRAMLILVIVGLLIGLIWGIFALGRWIIGLF